MPEVIRISDNHTLVPTKNYQYASWEFDEFNPVQSRLMDTYAGTSNVAIAAATSAGKTVCSEMYLAYEIRKRGGKGIYVGPLKALASEKEQDWTDDAHHFHDVNTAIVTGDFRFTGSRISELDKSDLIVMTPEMLASRCRNNKSEKSKFLQDVGTIVFDECFTEDALVLTEIGYIPIGMIIDHKMDVKVASYNHESCTVEYKKIVAFQKKSLRKRWHSIIYNGGNIIVTENQAIWVENKGYVAAKNVCVGDVLLVGEYDGKNKELDSSYSNREECDLRNSAWRWVDSSVWNGQIGTIESPAMLGTKRISRVEVREVKKIGWKPSDSVRKWRVRRQDIQFLNTIISRTKRNLRGGYSKRQENCDTEMVGSNRSSDCFGSLVYGRWQSSEEFNETSHRVISGRGSSIACGLADGMGRHRMSSVSNKRLFRVALHSRRKRSISRNCALPYNSENEIQIAPEDGRDFLFNVWGQIYSNKETHLRGQKGSALFGDLQEEVEEYVREIEEISSEESTCCDLEIEDNNNFFVMQPGSDIPVLCHNSHLLTVPRRGDHIEVALMKMMEINPEVRIVLLSATMPNVDEICGWVTKLTNRDTYFLESDYRPCPLSIHYEAYYDGDKSYDDKEDNKIQTACQIVNYYPDDKFLIFVHTKRTGKMMVEELDRNGVASEFHNAELNLKKRRELEDKFKNDKNFRVVVATSTLAWGLNLPARRVIVTGVHRGLTLVENYDIWQEVGRAGRPKYDPRGDAYILVPESNKAEHIARLKKQSPIRSTMLEFVGKPEAPHYKTLAFHVVSEIHHGSVKTKEGFHKWFAKSLAHHQDQDFDDGVVDRTIQLLEQYRAIVVEDGEYKCTAVGKVASMFYYSPFDVSDLRRNWKLIFDQKMEDNDYAVAMAMGNIDSNKWAIANRYEKEQMSMFQSKVERMFGENTYLPGSIKFGFAYYNMLKGKHVEVFSAIQAGLAVDLERTMQVIGAIDKMSCNWDRDAWFKTFKMRIQYGVEADMVDICRIPNVGGVRATRLKASKIKSLDDFINYDVATLAKIMKVSAKVAGEALEGAKLIQLKDSMDDV